METVIGCDVVVTANQMIFGELITAKTESMKREFKQITDTYDGMKFGFEFHYDKRIDYESNKLIFSCLIIYGKKQK